MVQFFCSINSFGPFKIRQFKTNCSGLKLDWGSTHRVLTEWVLRHYILLYIFVDMACKQLTMAASQACNLLRPDNLSGDLTDDFVNNLYLSLNTSPNYAMYTLL